MKVFEELQARGFIAQSTDEKKVRELLNESSISFYIGIDATANSLTAGHFSTLMAMKHLQLAGHRPIVLIGGGTTLIGDPSHRNEMRKIMSIETINENAMAIKKQIEKLIDFSDDRAIMVNNADWLTKLNYIEFLRDFGAHFNVNKMNQMESYKTRMKDGLTLLEFNYMPMQAYDFYHLFKEQNCVMQMGGSDQWSNIIGGVELIRKLEESEAYGLTFELLTTSTGEKMGKTASGAVWLDPEKTSPYDFFQYWRNVEDASVEAFLRRLTFLPLDEIEKLVDVQGAEINRAKEVLAYEITKIVHGEQEAKKALEAAKALFSAGSSLENVPSTELKEDAIGKLWLDVLIDASIISTKSEGRRLISQNGIRLNDEKISDPFLEVSQEHFENGYAMIQKGKKVFHKFTI